MNKNIQKIVVILCIIGAYFIIERISRKSANIKTYEEEKNIVRSSYGNEFYNYYSGDNNNNQEEPRDNINEVVIEGFSFKTDEEAVNNTHKKCPVNERDDTQIQNCIHLPNFKVEGLPPTKPIHNGFLVSVSCQNCTDTIQESLNKNNGEYRITNKEGRYILQKNNEDKQVVFPCTTDNINMIKNVLT